MQDSQFGDYFASGMMCQRCRAFLALRLPFPYILLVIVLPHPHRPWGVDEF
jgi:hypothetical protein